MASSAAFTYCGEYYSLSATKQLVKVKGKAWPPTNVKLFERKVIVDDDGAEHDETGQEMLERIKKDAVACEVRHTTSSMPVRTPVRVTPSLTCAQAERQRLRAQVAAMDSARPRHESRAARSSADGAARSYADGTSAAAAASAAGPERKRVSRSASNPFLKEVPARPRMAPPPPVQPFGALPAAKKAEGVEAAMQSARMDPPKPRGSTFHRTAALP